MTSTTTDASPQLAYQPALDGVRALAVAAVVIFHLDESGLTGGFLGVDTFFVLSGYLITTLLVLEWRRRAEHPPGTSTGPTIALGAFWARRARRLLPAVILVVIAVAIFAAIEVPPTELARLRWDGIAGLFYAANWRFVVSGQSYFDLFSAPSPFRHLWSLAIEEQFYLIWPLVTLACLRLGHGRLRVLAAVAALGAIASVGLMAALFTADDPSRAYYGTDTHAHTILIGVLLALLLVDRRAQVPSATARRVFDAMGVLAILAILAAFAFAHAASSRLYRGGSPAFALAVAALIASIMLAPRGVVGRVLAFRPFVMLGVVSYGVYLWHWPVIVYATEQRVHVSGATLIGLQVALTMTGAIASYLLVERPIRTRFGTRPHASSDPRRDASAEPTTPTTPARPRSRRVAWIAAPAGLAVATVALVAGTTGAEPPPDFLTRPPVVTSSTTLPPPVAGNPRHVVLVGDSVALSLGAGLDTAFTGTGIQFEATAVPGCGIIRGVTVQEDGRPYDWSRECDRVIFPALQTVIDTEPRPDLVLWLSSWDAVNRDVFGERASLSTAAGRAVFADEVQRAATLLTSRGARLMILALPRPVPGLPPKLPGFDDPVRVSQLNAIYRSAGATTDGRVAVVDLAGIVCPDGRCPMQVNGIELRPDGSHFGPAGAQYVGAQVSQVILECWRNALACRP